MVIWYSSRFEKSFKSLPRRIQLIAVARERLFRRESLHPSLFNHELGGKQLQGYRAFRVNYAYRILYKLNSDESVLFVDIGTHSIYR